MKFISLGSCCEVTTALSKIPRKYTLAHSPFDWCYTDTFDIVIDLINNNFTEINNCTHKTISYPDNTPAAKGKCLKNYNMFVGHYKEKWNDISVRRVYRFLDLLENSTEKLIFIRKNHVHKKVTIEQVNNFKKCIRDINPNLDFELFVFQEYYINEPIEILEDCVYYPIVSTNSVQRSGKYINKVRQGMWVTFEKLLNDYIQEL